MAVLTSTLVFSLWIISASSVSQIIETHLGKDVVLDCRGSSSNIDLVVWTRADMGPDEFVFFLEGDTASKSNQLPSYYDRVSLQDKHMKNGNVAVVLKHITISDNGTYECLTREKNTGRRKRAAGPDEPQSRNKIQLMVRDGSSHGHIGLLVAAVMVAAVFTVSGVVWKLKRSTKKRAEQPAADGEREGENLNLESVP